MASPKPAFATPAALVTRPHAHALSKRRAPRRACFPRRPPAATASSPSRPPTVQVGDIVAAQLGSTQVSVARVTGVAASGDTVDIEPLEEFVRELYVPGKAEATYARADAVRPVRAEFVPSQQGWIVLAQDLDTAKNYFEARAVGGAERVVVAAETPRELPPEALERQGFPAPTRTQAFAGAALSVPIAAAFYSGFGAAKTAYEANPVGEELLTGEVSRGVVQLALGGTSAATLLVGIFLLFYALQKKD